MDPENFFSVGVALAEASGVFVGLALVLEPPPELLFDDEHAESTARLTVEKDAANKGRREITRRCKRPGSFSVESFGRTERGLSSRW